MKLGRNTLCALLGVFAMGLGATAAVAADRPYTEGNVSTVSSIRTLPGMNQTYMKYLATTYKAMMEEQKKAGIIVDYAVYQVQPRGPDDANLYLVVTYKDMAAMDGLSDKVESIQARLIGTQEQRDAGMIDREKMRTMLGQEVIRELKLK